MGDTKRWLWCEFKTCAPAVLAMMVLGTLLQPTDGWLTAFALVSMIVGSGASLAGTWLYYRDPV